MQMLHAVTQSCSCCLMNSVSHCFSLFHRDMIATGCEDKCVRVFYVAASTDLPLKIFSGKDYVSLAPEAYLI